MPVLDSVMNALAGLLGSAGRPQIGRQHALDEGYFTRIAAIDFAMRHDDGQARDDLESADVVLVGVSRTSKTPTCVYLAHRGIKAANVPIVTEAAAARRLAQLQRPLIVGLTINPGSAGADPAHPPEDARPRAGDERAASAATMPTSIGSAASWSWRGACSPGTTGPRST